MILSDNLDAGGHLTGGLLVQVHRYPFHKDEYMPLGIMMSNVHVCYWSTEVYMLPNKEQ